jgi:hypothetical protein
MARTLAGGSGNYLKIAGLPTNIGAYPQTFACWARPTSSALAMLAGLNDGSSTYIGLAVNASYGAAAILNAGGGLQEIDSGTGANGVWAHYAATFGSTARAYFNGTGGSTYVPTQPTVSITQMGTIWSGGALNFAGDLAEIALWNIALSATDIAALAAGVRADTIQVANLKDYWRVSGTSSPEPNEVSGAVALTINGSCPQAASDPPWISGGPPPQTGRMFALF